LAPAHGTSQSRNGSIGFEEQAIHATEASEVRCRAGGDVAQRRGPLANCAAHIVLDFSMHLSYIAAGVGPSLVVIGRRSLAVRIAITSRLNPAHLP
jgi:hypothetical protein